MHGRTLSAVLGSLRKKAQRDEEEGTALSFSNKQLKKYLCRFLAVPREPIARTASRKNGK
jgi:hypothetical protein